jgi:hypothetical protein
MAATDALKSNPGDYKNRRSMPRYPLIATVEVVEAQSEMRLAGRISEIGRNGCYIDVLNTLPAGTLVQVRISRDSGTFTTAARIVYVHEGMGMGVAFLNPPEEQLKVLDGWLAELTS